MNTTRETEVEKDRDTENQIVRETRIETETLRDIYKITNSVCFVCERVSV